MLDKKYSQEIAQTIGAVQKECWRNAMLAFMSLEELQDGYYVEGYCIASIPIEHGWIELEEQGKTVIIDPTLVLSGTFDGHYIPGIRYSYQDVQSFWDQTLPHVWDDHRGGMTNEEYKDAFLKSHGLSSTFFD